MKAKDLKPGDTVTCPAQDRYLHKKPTFTRTVHTVAPVPGCCAVRVTYTDHTAVLYSNDNELKP